jgi:murein DD-endopeptidase MepM/ murein hydrolase activator NlpD
MRDKGVIVQSGDIIRRGAPIGYMGSTGLSSARHLHFMVFQNGAIVDPADFVPAYRNVPGYKYYSVPEGHTQGGYTYGRYK